MTGSSRPEADYYDNPDLEGEPRLTRVDPAVDLGLDRTPRR